MSTLVDAVPARPFRAYGVTHLGPLALVLAACLLLPWLSFSLERSSAVWIGRILGIILATTVVAWTFAQGLEERLDPSAHLPLDLCNLLALATPFVAWEPTLRVHEVYYYLVMSGTLQANLTPDLRDDFPHRNYLKYWLVHGGLVVYAVYGVAGLSLVPTLTGVGTAFLVVLLYSALLYPLNLVLGANYCYLVRKPDQPTLLDFFGPWPLYVGLTFGVGLALFVMFWLAARTIAGFWG